MNRRSDALIIFVGTGHINSDVSFFISSRSGGMLRQMRLWDMRRFEEDVPNGRTVMYVWVSYHGVVINREFFSLVRKDRNGKNPFNNKSKQG